MPPALNDNLIPLGPHIHWKPLPRVSSGPLNSPGQRKRFIAKSSGWHRMVRSNGLDLNLRAALIVNSKAVSSTD